MKKTKQPAPPPVDLDALPADVASGRKTGAQAKDLIDEIVSDPIRRDELHRRIDAAGTSAIADGIDAFKAGKSKEAAVAKLIDKSGLDDASKEDWRERLDAMSYLLHERAGGVLPCPHCDSFGPHYGADDGINLLCTECDEPFDADDCEWPEE